MARLQTVSASLITRIHETGPDAPQRRILPTWIAFTDQSNPDWEDQEQLGLADPAVPVARPDAASFARHDEGPADRLQGPLRDQAGRCARPRGAELVPELPTAVYLDPATGQPRYAGPQRPLAFVGDPFETASLDVTHNYPAAEAVRATFTNGILSTQNLLKQLEDVQNDGKPAGRRAGPAIGITHGSPEDAQGAHPDAGRPASGPS